MLKQTQRDWDRPVFCPHFDPRHCIWRFLSQMLMGYLDGRLRVTEVLTLGLRSFFRDAVPRHRLLKFATLLTPGEGLD
jgi:hypothetical protein